MSWGSGICYCSVHQRVPDSIATAYYNFIKLIYIPGDTSLPISVSYVPALYFKQGMVKRSQISFLKP